MPTPYSPRAGSASPAFGGHLRKNLSGICMLMPGAVAGVGFAATGAAVVQVDQHGHGLADDLVGFLALDVDDKADAAGIVLEGGIVEALFGRQAGLARRTMVLGWERSLLMGLSFWHLTVHRTGLGR